MTDPTRLHAHEMAALLRGGEVSSRELTEAHLVAAERDNRALNAWLTIDRERALAEADAADARLAAARRDPAHALDRLRPLLGIPVGLKDLVSLKGGQCTAGSRILEGYRAPYDAHITERLREVGAVILGKTNMDEFAMGSSTEHSAFGPTANPWALDRVPGGSSGGSSAAVAAYHTPLAIGTDTGGSIRQPAALCGVVGMKPTYGRVSRYGIVAFASSLDQIGPFARDVRDAAALLHVVAGRDERDATSSPVPVPATLTALPASDDEAAGIIRGVRFGLPREYFVAGMEPEVEARIREAVAALEAAGATVEEVSLPHTDYGLATYYIVAPAEASANLARYDGIRYGRHAGDGDTLANYLATRGGGFGAEVKRRIMLGTYALSAGYYDAYYLKAQKVRTLIKGDFDKVWATGVDALVAPTAATVAFRFGARLADPVSMYLSDACTLPVNMAGLPGVSVPCGLSDGLPVGLQFIGPAWSEARLLGLARGYEAITADAPWRDVEPAELAAAADPSTPTPAERMAALRAVGTH
jgi:aspartyl-tRNA(Asn)/glutamyl-tRNA(Gln) amidotransferase subunit A